MNIRSRLRIRTRLRSVGYRIWPPKPKPLILMYHRVSDEPIDHWRLAVSPTHFEEQLQVLRRSRYPMPLVDFVHKLKADSLPPNAVALTFDDGYADNLLAGKPRLAAADVSATVFLTTGYIDRPDAFWWDELAWLILVEIGPQSFELVVHRKSLWFDFSTEPAARKDGATAAAKLTKRRAALWTLREILRTLEDEERQQIMSSLRSMVAVRDYRRSLGRAMTSEEVRVLTMDGLVTIGAHTVTHPMLSKLGTPACRREITLSKLTCEALVGRPVTAFAYPYGDFDAQACDTVHSAGFTLACSTQRGPAIATSDVIALPRIDVPNLDGDAFEQALRSASATD